MELKPNSNDALKCDLCGRQCSTKLGYTRHIGKQFCQHRQLFQNEVKRAESDGYKVEWEEDISKRLLAKNIFRITKFGKTRRKGLEAIARMQEEGILSPKPYKLWWDSHYVSNPTIIPVVEPDEKRKEVKLGGYMDAYVIHMGVMQEMFGGSRFKLYQYFNSLVGGLNSGKIK